MGPGIRVFLRRGPEARHQVRSGGNRVGAAPLLATLGLGLWGAFAPASGQAPQPTPYAGYPQVADGGNYGHNYLLPQASSSTPWTLGWHPDGDRIAVGMSGSIWLVTPETGVAEEVVYGPKYYASPDFSPDGRWMVFTADDSGRSIELEVLDLQTGQRHVLTADDQVTIVPRFSPELLRAALLDVLRRHRRRCP